MVLVNNSVPVSELGRVNGLGLPFMARAVLLAIVVAIGCMLPASLEVSPTTDDGEDGGAGDSEDPRGGREGANQAGDGGEGGRGIELVHAATSPFHRREELGMGEGDEF